MNITTEKSFIFVQQTYRYLIVEYYLCRKKTYDEDEIRIHVDSVHWISSPTP